MKDSGESTLQHLIENADKDQPMSVRVMHAIQASHSHSMGLMPIYPVEISPTDFMWIDEVSKAVIENQARPPHPNPQIEDLLQSLFAA